MKSETQQEKNIALYEQLYTRSKVDVMKCYQCGKCSGGCPVAEYMDIVPRKVVRMVQLGMMDEALHSKAIWLCASCETCASRCPKQVEVSKVMETLRIMAKEQGYVAEKDMDKFHDVFLGLVKNFGRVYEAGLIVGRNVWTGHLFRDIEYGIPYLTKGKIELLPHKSKQTQEIKDIFERALKVEQRGQH